MPLGLIADTREVVASRELLVNLVRRELRSKYKGTALGWAWSLVLAELAPDRADQILRRGLAYGESRAVCGVHYPSDVEAGRIVGATIVTRLKADPAFQADFAKARIEFEAARVAATQAAPACPASLARQPW